MRYVRSFFALMMVLVCLDKTVLADDFRIETKVYSGTTKSPVSENTTLFEAGYVYDYLSKPERVAVFDQPHGRFILLDPACKLKAEVKTEDVRLFADKFRAVAEQSSRPLMKFAADPDFKIESPQDNELTFSSQYITYRLETLAANTPEIAQQYREFSDWYARFNAMSSPGSTPPFPRMAVNEELAKRGLVPKEVQLTIAATPGAKAVSMRSEHHVSWRLLPKDHKKIAETGNQLTTFKTVDFDKFEPPAVAKRPSAKGP